MCGETKLVDVDGSYLFQKLVRDGLPLVPLGFPEAPPSEWEAVGERNYEDMAHKIPKISPGKENVVSCLLDVYMLFFMFAVHVSMETGNNIG